MDTNTEIRERILAAAEQLFGQAERREHPSLEAVRELSRASMSDVSAVMSEWRRLQIVSASGAAASLRERVSRANSGSPSSLWNEAHQLARESMDVAQAAWLAERSETEKLRVELSASFEFREVELEALAAKLVQAEGALAVASAAAQKERQASSAAFTVQEAELQALRARCLKAEQELAATVAAAQTDRAASSSAFNARGVELVALRATLGETEKKLAATVADAERDRMAALHSAKTSAADIEALRVKLATIEGKAAAAAATAQHQRAALSLAVESKESELQALKLKLVEVEGRAAANASTLERERKESGREIAELANREQVAIAQALEIEKRAKDLRVVSKAALNDAEQSVQRLTTELEAEQGRHSATRSDLESLSAEHGALKARALAQAGALSQQAEQLKQMAAELSRARALATSDRDEAKIRDQDESVTTQHAELLRFVEARDKSKSGKKQ